ncbi:unnamed protein product [Spodoptera littoralis]|uniref:Uncharacterized protein n=1 Tax=Spodoptera littoralis TaxID=7109 RepID=A0A9P0IKZ2_SPOLI|nr:unnamed protein product [Spodoptera littoralis]CAH1646928.1 unnamed protein product [Spodoptera littoralis]
MERGSSAPWSQILQETIGEGRLNGEALRDYFRPLEDWLRISRRQVFKYTVVSTTQHIAIMTSQVLS